MKKTGLLAVVCLGVLAVGLASVAQAGVSLAARPLVRNLIHAGTGCPAGTVVMGYNRSGELEVGFDSFVTEAGRGVPLSEVRKFCQFNFEIAPMRGVQLGLRLLREEGAAGLDFGMTSNHRVSEYVSGASTSISAAEALRGPMEREYTIDHRAGNAVMFFPCGVTRAVNVKLSGDLRGRGEGFDSLQAIVFEVVARRCN